MENVCSSIRFEGYRSNDGKKKEEEEEEEKNVLALNTNDKRMTTVIPLAAPLPYRTHFSYDKRKNGRMPRRQVAFTIKPTDTRFKFLSPRRGWTADQTWTGHEKSSSIFHVDPLNSYHHRSSKPLPRPVHHDDTWSMTRNDKNCLTRNFSWWQAATAWSELSEIQWSFSEQTV